MTDTNNTESQVSTDTFRINLSEDHVYNTVTSLYAYIDKKQTNNEQYKTKNKLFDTDNNTVYMQICLNVLPTYKSLKPHRITLKHGIYSIDNDTICLIVKDGFKDKMTDIINKKFDENAIKINKIIEISKFKKHYQTDKQKRDLCNSYTYFLIDDRLVKMVKSIISKSFVTKRKLPISIPLSQHSSSQGYMLRAVNSTYLYISQGNLLQVKIGNYKDMSKQQLVDNIINCSKQLCKYLPTNNDSVIQSLYIKTYDSIALPLYAKLPQYRSAEQLQVITEQRMKKRKRNAVTKLDERIQLIDKIIKNKLKNIDKSNIDDNILDALDDNELYNYITAEFGDENNDLIQNMLNSSKNSSNKRIKTDDSSDVKDEQDIDDDNDSIKSESDIDDNIPDNDDSVQQTTTAKNDKKLSKQTTNNKRKLVNKPQSRDTQRWLQSVSRSK